MRSHFSIHSLQFRIIAAFLAALLTTFGAQGILMYNQVGVGQNLDLVAQGYLPLSNVGTRLEQDHQRVVRDVERLAGNLERPGTGATSSTVIYTDAFARNLSRGKDVLTQVRTLNLPGDELAVLTMVDNHLTQIDALAKRYEEGATKFVATSELQEEERDTKTLENLLQTGKDLDLEIGKLNRLLDNRIQSLTQTTQETQTRSIAIAAGLGVVAFAFSFVLILAVVFAIRPIRSLTTQVQKLTGGDFSGKVEVRGSDEIALLAGEFNHMVDALKLRDQTLVQRAEQLNRLSRYLTSVLDGMDESLLVAEDGQVTLANRAAMAIWGAERGAALPAPLNEAVKQQGPQQIEGPESTLHDVRIGPFGDQGHLVISADVTDQVLTQQRLAQSERLALVGKMLAQITHEVRNPLNAMSLNAELLSEELGLLDPKKSTEAWSMLGIIASEIERLTDLSAHYLQLARRPRAKMEAQNLTHLIEEVAHLLHPELARREFSLQLDCADIPAQAVDGSQLKQALLNIIRNAMEAEATEARLSTKMSQGWVHISVSDNGPGMSEEQIAQACDPFWSTKAQGTGLGLAITQQIIEEHAGQLTVQANDIGGTQVILSLPETQITEKAPEESHVPYDLSG